MEQMNGTGGSGMGRPRQESGSSQQSSIDGAGGLNYMGGPGGGVGSGAGDSMPSTSSPASYWSSSQLPNTADYLPGMANYHDGASQVNHPQGAGGHLSTIAMSFPSSHDFPDASPPAGSFDEASAARFGNSMAGRMDQMAGGANMGMAPDMRGIQQQQQQQQQRLQQQSSNARSSSTTQNKRKEDGSASRMVDGMDRRASRDDSDGPLWQKRSSPTEPSQTYPPINVRPQAIDRAHFTSQLKATAAAAAATTARQPDELELLCAAFYGKEAAEERRRIQPHLVDLKERRREERRRKMLAQAEAGKGSNKVKKRQSDSNMASASAAVGSDGDTSMGGDGADGKDKSSGSGSGSAAAGRKPPHTLLTEAEKKANHIASEQKRRANIRKGYEMLCSGMPSLNDALDDGTGAGGGDGGAESGGDAAGGDKLDGRAGPRSEAVVLGHCEYGMSDRAV